MISRVEVAKHDSPDSCWVIVKGQAYDLTEFLDEHPGGKIAILRHAGKDATEEYEKVHDDGLIERTLPPEKCLGQVDEPPNTISSATNISQKLSLKDGIPMSLCLCIDDIEEAAKRVISREAWTYYHSASDGLGSLRNNQTDWRKISLRPRVMINVERVDMRRTILGFESRLPFFIAPAARAKLVHPDGELCLVRGAARGSIPYCSSTGSSISHEKLAACLKSENAAGGQACLYFQLYVARDKSRTLDLIAKARELGFRALVITVDTAVVGKREEDERYLAEQDLVAGDSQTSKLASWTLATGGPNAPPLRGHHSSTLNWKDLGWIKEAWGAETGPIVLKGIQTVEDALIAAEANVDAIYLSNHGGRQCDDAPSSIRTLLEIRRFHPEILAKVEVYLDGWVRRGADVIKAICLGATGVALGRPFMYAVGAYGTEGVLRAIQILSEEVETTMRLIGVTSLDQLNPNYVNTSILEQDLPKSLEWDQPKSLLRSRL